MPVHVKQKCKKKKHAEIDKKKVDFIEQNQCNFFWLRLIKIILKKNHDKFGVGQCN